MRKLFLSIILFFFLLFSANAESDSSYKKASVTTNQLAIFKTIEKDNHGKLGVFAVDLTSGRSIAFHAHQRFPLCSTSKFLVAAVLLKQSIKDPGILAKKRYFTEYDVERSGYAPVTKKQVNQGMRVKALAHAAMTATDNAAMNELMTLLGGPLKITSQLKIMGDSVSHLNRAEPDLNSAIPGDFRDTSTPYQMTKNLQRWVLSNVLPDVQKKQLRQWLIDNKTGDARIRAGVPVDWLVGDKTGTGGYGTTNDIGVIWPPSCSPIIVSIYFTQQQASAKPNDQVVAQATQYILKIFSHYNRCLLQY